MALTVAGSVLHLNMAAARVLLRTLTAAVAVASTQTWLVLQLWVPDRVDDKKRSATDDKNGVGATGASERNPMYTLSKAKEEIDAIANHALAIATHALAIDDKLDAKLEGFKRDILASIEVKFADLEKAILGESQRFESSAVSDLGARVALLKQASPAAPAPHETSGDDNGGYAPSHPSSDHDTNAGYQSDQYGSESGSY